MKQGGLHRAGKGFTISASQQGSSGRVPRSGFTIVEVLIVLAVSSLIFLVAVAFISGRQAKTQFTVAMNDMRQQVQQIINETSSGYYPNQNFNCQANAAGQPTITGGTQSQGTKNGCVFLGKVIQFGVASGASNLGGIVYPVIGNQNAMSLVTAAPVVPVVGGATPVDLSAPFLAENGLTVSAMYYNGSRANTTSGIGFLSGAPDGTYATSGASGVGLASGSLQFSLYAVRGTQINVTTKAAMVTALNALQAGTPPVAPTNLVNVSEVDVCFNGGTNQSGLITIGKGGIGSVGLTIVNGSTTC